MRTAGVWRARPWTNGLPKFGIRTIAMPLPRFQRGEIWLVDLGYLGNVRPVLVVSVPFLEHERTLCTMIPRTTTLVGTRFEVKIEHAVLKEGAFDVQQTAAGQAAKFVRRLD